MTHRNVHTAFLPVSIIFVEK